MVTVQGAGSGPNAGIITNVAQAVAVGLGSATGKIVAIILALFFLFITVVYNYSFARLIFVSGLDRRLPPVMSHVNRAPVPDVAVWVQTAIAGLFTLVPFAIVPPASGGNGLHSEARVNDALPGPLAPDW